MSGSVEVTSTDLQRNWGAVMAEIHAGEIVTVTNHGRPDMVVVPPHIYEALLKAKRELGVLREAERGRLRATSEQQQGAMDR
jgi:prevent-host-death family protein